MLRGRTNPGDNSPASIAGSPFGTPGSEPSRFQFPIAIMLLITVVFTACFSMVLMAIRIPEVQGMVADLFGGSQGSRSKAPVTQLRFLLVCYSAPLMIAGITGIIYYIANWVSSRQSSSSDDGTESPFS